MGVIVLFITVAYYCITKCQSFRKIWGENIYISVSDKRLDDSICAITIWLVFLIVAKAWELNYHGYGWAMFVASLFSVYWIGQAYSVMILERKFRINFARSEVQAGNFHRREMRQDTPETKGTSQAETPTPRAETREFEFDPSRFK